jgi:hypothetical protein
MRKTLTTIHVVLAAFFLPTGLMFAVTGGLYTWEIAGRYATTDARLALDFALPSDLSGLVALAEAELARRGLEPPSGAARIRKGGTSQYFEWTGTRRDVQIHPTTEANAANLRIMETGAHRFFVQLHKAKGGVPFKLFAAAWATALVALLGTGLAIAWLSPLYRRTALAAGIAGIGTFALLAAVS